MKHFWVISNTVNSGVLPSPQILFPWWMPHFIIIIVTSLLFFWTITLYHAPSISQLENFEFTERKNYYWRWATSIYEEMLYPKLGRTSRCNCNWNNGTVCVWLDSKSIHLSSLHPFLTELCSTETASRVASTYHISNRQDGTTRLLITQRLISRDDTTPGFDICITVTQYLLNFQKLMQIYECSTTIFWG